MAPSPFPSRIGIAIGPRTWFGDQALNNISQSGTVIGNRLTGAFGYGIAVGSARNFTIQGNTLIGNTTFIGARGPNCSTTEPPPTPAAFVIDWSTVSQSTTQFDFTNITNGDGLTCILPPDGGDFWPFGGNPNPAPGEPGVPGTTTDNGANGNTNGTAPVSASGSSGLSGGAQAGIAIGVILGVGFLALATYFIREWALKRAASRNTENPWSKSGYVQKEERVSP